jgi:hypothetical protein
MTLLLQNSTQYPFRLKQFAAIIDNVHTEFVITDYGDQIFFIITQLNKLGTILRGKKDSIIGNSADECSLYSVQTLLGKRDDSLLELFARQLTEMVNANSPQKSVVLAISLKDGQSSSQTLKKILSLLRKHFHSQ